MNLTHAAVSAQIRRLEEWLGQKLFERKGRGLVLTPTGIEFQQVVVPALVSIASSAHRIRQKAEQHSVRVACVPSIAMRWLIPALKDFYDRHRGINIQVIYAKGFETFDPDRYDVLITELAEKDAGARAVKLFPRSIRPVASRSYIAKHRHFTDGSLEGARLLHDETLEDWERWFEKSGRRPKKYVDGPIFGDFNLLSAAMITGQGIALCPVDMYRREIARGDLIVLSEVATSEEKAYYLTVRDNRNSLITTFKKWFVGVCSCPT